VSQALILRRRANQKHFSARPALEKRGARDVTNVERGMRWTQAALWTKALTCGRRSRVVLAPRRWRELATMLSHCAGTVTKKPDRRRERGVSRKPIVPETPDDLALPVVTLLVCFFHSRTRLRVWLNTRRFLRPLFFGAAAI